MKVLITEQQLQTLYEISDRIKQEVDIIYQDRNVVCLVPKTQETSKIYGSNANWCQRHKTGFEMWSERGLLIRFLFRGGRKIRTTYYFKGKSTPNEKYYWANENGYHVLTGHEENPFDAVNRTGRIRDTERDIIEHINMIPDECKNKVLEFIQKYEKGYDYCYKKEEYHTKKEVNLKNNINLIKNKYQKYLIYINSDDLDYFDIFLNNDEYSLTYGVGDLFNTVSTHNFKEFNSQVFNSLKEILSYMKQNKTQPKRDNKPHLYYSGGQGYDA